MFSILRHVKVGVKELLLHFFQGIVFLKPTQHVGLRLLEQLFDWLCPPEIFDLFDVWVLLLPVKNREELQVGNVLNFADLDPRLVKQVQKFVLAKHLLQFLLLESWHHRVSQSILLALGHRIGRNWLFLLNDDRAIEDLVNKLDLLLKLFYQLFRVMIQLGPFKVWMLLLILALQVLQIDQPLPLNQPLLQHIQRVRHRLRHPATAFSLIDQRVHLYLAFILLTENVKWDLSFFKHDGIEDRKVRQGFTLKGQLLQVPLKLLDRNTLLLRYQTHGLVGKHLGLLSLELMIFFVYENFGIQLLPLGVAYFAYTLRI